MKNVNWLDIRRHGFFRVALVIPRVDLMNPDQNAKNHLEMLKKAHEQGAQYAICPELGLTGYSAQDMFFQGVLLDAALDALATILEETKEWDMLITVGIPLAFGANLYNCAVSMYQGVIKTVVPKSYLPNYREFYEKRWFAMADDASFNSVILLGQTVPFGNNLLVCSQQNPDVVIHEEVCEDSWVPVPQSALAALNDATILSNLSASNVTIGKATYRENVVVGAASGSCLAAKLYVSAGFGESTSDVAWDGQAIVAEHGSVVATNDRFNIEPTLTIHDVNVHMSVAERRRQGSFRDNATSIRHRMKSGAFDFRRVPFSTGETTPLHGYDKEVFHRFECDIQSHPFVPSNPDTLHDRCREVLDIQTFALVRRMQHLAGSKIILGLSGGLDSTHALLVAVRAADILHRNRKDIICITMPGFGTTSGTKSNAIDLADALSVTIREIPITSQLPDMPPGIAEQLLGLVGHDGLKQDLTFENSQAWCRKVVELATASKEHGFVLGTGTLSELALGHCTMFGDHASHYGINAGLAKTLVKHMVRWEMEYVFQNWPHIQAPLQRTLENPMSPELLRPTGDAIVQISEDMVGPYVLHDFTQWWGVRFGIRPSTIARLGLQAFEGEYDLQTLVKWQKVFWQRFFAAQFKRNCVPDSTKVGLVCYSPRGDWRMPSDARPDTWLHDLDSIEV